MAKKVGLQKPKPVVPPDSVGDSIGPRDVAKTPGPESNGDPPDSVVPNESASNDAQAPDQNDESLKEDGTLASGYAEDGPYHCEDCIHVQGSVCIHPVVANDPALATRKTGNGVTIDPERGCCRYVRPPEEKKGPVSEEGREGSSAISY